MSKKIRFPLEMDNGVEVRDLEALRENFSIGRVIEYAKNGKLVTWLKDRYATELAEEVEKIDVNDSQIARKICDVFGVEYSDEMQADMEKSAERLERIKRLRKYTDNKEFEKNIDMVAFDQDELYDLLDENRNMIYLCGDRFSIPVSKEDMTYIGINNPTVVIESKVEVDWNAKNIVLNDVSFDEKYQKIVDEKEIRGEKDSAAGKFVKDDRFKEYNDNTYLAFMLSPAERDASKKTFSILSNELSGVIYDIDADIKDIKKELTNMKIVGMAKDYLERL